MALMQTCVCNLMLDILEKLCYIKLYNKKMHKERDMQNTQVFNATTEDRYTVISTHYTGETMDGCAMFDCVILDTHEGDVYVQENCMCMDCALLQTEGVADCITYKQYKKST